MSLLGRLRDTVRSGADSQFDYYCRECATEFSAVGPTRIEVECPECGASGPRALARR